MSAGTALHRELFATPRAGEFFDLRALQAQTGQPATQVSGSCAYAVPTRTLYYRVRPLGQDTAAIVITSPSGMPSRPRARSQPRSWARHLTCSATRQGRAWMAKRRVRACSTRTDMRRSHDRARRQHGHVSQRGDRRPVKSSRRRELCGKAGSAVTPGLAAITKTEDRIEPEDLTVSSLPRGADPWMT